MRHFLITLALAFLSFGSLAQSVSVSGTITDQNKNPIPYASVYIKNTTKGTSANSEGKYQLHLSPGQYEVLFKAIGYHQESRKLDISENQTLNISLIFEAYQLKGVTIGGGKDPAYAIIRKAIKNRPLYLKQVNAYNCEVYIKGMQKLLNAPKKFLGADIDKVARENGLDSNRRGIIYLSESQSKLTFAQPDKVHEEMISSKVSGRNNAFSFNRASDIKVDFYENLQHYEGISNRPLVSPIADKALSFYNYKLLGTTVENGETINKIQVIPKRPYDPAFEGAIYIIKDSWRIYSVDLYITKKASINFVDTLRVNQQFLSVNKNIWMPSAIKFDFVGGVFGFRFSGYYIAIYKNYDLNPAIKKGDFNVVLRITKEVNKKDSVYWVDARPIPLTSEEVIDYRKKEVLAKKRQSKSYLDSIDHINNQFKLKRMLLGRGYNHSNRFKKEYYHFGSIANSMLYNTVEGFAIDYDASYSRQIDSLNNSYLHLGGKIRYGFSSRAVHGSINGDIPINKTFLSFNIGTDVLDMNDQRPFGLGVNTYYSLFERQNFQKFYEKQFIDLSLSRRIIGGWQATLSFELANRNWLSNTSNYSFFYNDSRQFTANNPIHPEGNQPLFNNSSAFKVNLRTTYNFSNLYETYPTGRYYIPSKYPVVGLNYTKGFKNVFGSDVDYDLLSADVTKKDISLGLYGKTSFYIGAGKFLNASKVFFTDYKHFSGNQLLEYDPGINKFLLLDYYKYSTNSQYLEAHLEHNFSGLFLNKLPLIRKLKLQEIVNLNYLTTPDLKNYSEAACGLQYLFIRLMYGVSYNNGNKLNTGIRLGIDIK